MSAAARFDSWSSNDHRYPPGVLVEILFSHQSVPTHRDAVISRVKDVGVFQLAHCLEFVEHSAYLPIDILDTGVLSAQLVSNGGFISLEQNSLNGDLVAKSGMTMMERVSGKVVFLEWGGLGDWEKSECLYYQPRIYRAG